MTAARLCVVVLGMHRSGTSALTGCLGLLGVPLGAPLMEPTVDNEKGYWELVEVGKLHDELLTSFGASALEPASMPEGWLSDPRTKACRERLLPVLERNFAGEPLWAVKDPRLCLLLPLWQQLLEELAVEPRFVLCLRNPWDVARSLESRDDLGPRDALELWRRHVGEAERATRSHVRGVVPYDALLADPRAELEGLAAALGLSWPRSPGDALPELRSFLEPALRHWRDTGPPSGVPEPVVSGAGALLEAHLALRRRPDDPGRLPTVDRADGDLAASLGAWVPAGRPAEPFEIVWRAAEVPGSVRAGATFRCRVSFRNEGAQRLSRRALSLSYHWLVDGPGEGVAVWDGVRTIVRAHVPPGAEHDEEMTVRAPDVPGRYLLVIDLIREGEYWFSSRGAPTARRTVEVQRAAERNPLEGCGPL